MSNQNPSARLSFVLMALLGSFSTIFMTGMVFYSFHQETMKIHRSVSMVDRQLSAIDRLDRQTQNIARLAYNNMADASAQTVVEIKKHISRARAILTELIQLDSSEKSTAQVFQLPLLEQYQERLMMTLQQYENAIETGANFDSLSYRGLASSVNQMSKQFSKSKNQLTEKKRFYLNKSQTWDQRLVGPVVAVAAVLMLILFLAARFAEGNFKQKMGLITQKLNDFSEQAKQYQSQVSQMGQQKSQIKADYQNLNQQMDSLESDYQDLQQQLQHEKDKFSHLEKVVSDMNMNSDYFGRVRKLGVFKKWLDALYREMEALSFELKVLSYNARIDAHKSGENNSDAFKLVAKEVHKLSNQAKALNKQFSETRGLWQKLTGEIDPDRDFELKYRDFLKKLTVFSKPKLVEKKAAATHFQEVAGDEPGVSVNLSEGARLQ